MPASSLRCTAPPRCRPRPSAFQGCLLGIFLATLVFLLSTSSDACVPPPPFVALEPIDKLKPQYSVGEKIQYRCKKGWVYQFPFLTVTTCEWNQSWIPISDHACNKVKCPYLNNPHNGKIEYPNGSFQWGDQVHFYCFNGYYLVGKEVILCELRGDQAHWADKMPQCEKILCKPPPEIKNGKYTFSDVDVFEYKEAVTYSCDPAPKGEEEFSLVGESILYCAANEVWSSEPPQCKVVKCPYPEVKHGKLLAGHKQKYSYKATVAFGCASGFYLNGSEIIVCSGNSTWEPPLPTCLKVSTLPSTKLPISTVSGFKPTHPTKPPVYNYPGYPNPREGLLDIELGYRNPREGLLDIELDMWLIILIILTSIVAVIVIIYGVHRYLENKKKGTNLTDDSRTQVKFTSQQNEKKRFPFPLIRKKIIRTQNTAYQQKPTPPAQQAA